MPANWPSMESTERSTKMLHSFEEKDQTSLKKAEPNYTINFHSFLKPYISFLALPYLVQCINAHCFSHVCTTQLSSNLSKLLAANGELVLYSSLSV